MRWAYDALAVLRLAGTHFGGAGLVVGEALVNDHGQIARTGGHFRKGPLVQGWQLAQRIHKRVVGLETAHAAGMVFQAGSEPVEAQEIAEVTGGGRAIFQAAGGAEALRKRL